MDNERNSSNTTVVVVILALLLLVPCVLGPLVLGGMFFLWKSVPAEPQVIDMPVPMATLEHVQPVSQSTLYVNFDPAALKEKYSPRFAKDKSESSVEGLKVIATGEIYKAVELEGVISDEEFEKVVEEVQAEILELAKSSSVTIAGEPNTDLKERPEWLFTIFFREGERDLVRGSFISYSQGPIQGAVEIMTMATQGEKKPGWKLLVVVHEK